MKNASTPATTAVNAKATRQLVNSAMTPAVTVAMAMPTAELVMRSVSGACRTRTGTVSPMYTSAPGIAAAKHAPVTPRATTSHPTSGTTAEASPPPIASRSASRIVRTRPSRSETTAHPTCAMP